MQIRQENEADYENIYRFVKTAFETAKVSDGKEQDFVNQLRAGEGYIPALALVAEKDGRLAGHVMLSRMTIDTENGALEALLLAPLSVSLEDRSRGIGAQLVTDVLARAKGMGYRSVFVVGDPAYYQKFGFTSSVAFGVRNANEIPDEYVMALELAPDALKDVRGTVDFHCNA